MTIDAEITFMLALLPVLAAAACQLGFVSFCVAPARSHASITALMLSLFGALACLLLAAGERKTPSLSASQLVLLALALLAAHSIAAPLLDRARRGGLVLGSVLGAGVFIHCSLTIFPNLLPPLPRSGVVLVVLLAASIMGLIGSHALPRHPLRYTRHGQPKQSTLPQGWVVVGTSCFALAVALLGWAMQPPEAPLAQVSMLISALVSATLVLLVATHQRHPAPLALTAQALVAGVVLALLVQSVLCYAIACGVLAGVCLLLAPHITQALQIDDAPNTLGMLLLPSAAGLVLPGVMQPSLLAEQLQWLGTTLAMGALAGILLWPLCMLLLGLEANSRRVREGFALDE